MFSAFGDYGELLPHSTQYKAVALAKQDGEKGKFPIKLRDEAISASIAFLKSKGLFPDKDDDSEDEMVFGDDDFPCDQEEEPAAAGWPVPAVDVSAYHEGKLKKVRKEGGKKGSEIAGAADMGGIEFFTTTCETPEGDTRLLEIVCQEMNAPVDPSAEETKGGSGHIGKLVMSASDKQLALIAYVPEEKVERLTATAWMQEIFKAFGDYGEFVGETTPYKAVAVAKQDGEKGKFPLKLRDEAISASIAFLKGKGLFPDKDDDSEEEYCFGDDDFPCGQ